MSMNIRNASEMSSCPTTVVRMNFVIIPIRHIHRLPPSDDDVTVNFWQGYDKAEKMNEDMQRKIKKGWYGDSPIKTLMSSRNEKERQAAVDRIVPAIEETMRENKISPIFLTLENKSPQMLLLEAA